VKGCLVSILVLAAAPLLAACAATGHSQAAADSNVRNIYVGGNATANREVQVPATSSDVSNEPHYTLRGDKSVSPVTTAVQADAWAGLPVQGTNGF